ncbi:MAG TPA: ABC transporter permease [Candidatus Sulfopaludibacter sp.]|jgi:hypothetical protein|nr:ABC transporter permease [Candidatus Sulfopaludibacter sp.]
MRLPLESRLLLTVAAAVAPPELRDDWWREWEAEIWWWMGSHTGERLQLFVHCSGAVCDAAYLRATQAEFPETLLRMARSPGACLLALVLLIAAVIAPTRLRETRRVLHGEPFAGAPLVLLSQSLPFMGAHYGVPPGKLADWNARAQSLEGAALYLWTSRNPAVAHASANFFSLLQTRPLLGTLTPLPDDPPGVVLSYAAWQRKFHSDPGVIGRTTEHARVIGVLPADFWFLDARPELWILALPADLKQAPAVARLKPGISPAQARNELRQLAAQVKPVTAGTAVIVEPISGLSARPLSTLGIPWLALVCVASLGALLAYRRTPRYAAFLAAKAALSLTLVLLVTVEFGSSWMTINSGETNLFAGVVSLWLFLAGPAAVLYWCWRDQALRCRTCLHRLSLPVTFGTGARTLLERAGTELVCSRGHGTLFTADGADPAPQWDPMDGSWRELFVNK